VGYIVSADLSQLELRLIASDSGDAEMTKAFREGRDLHTYAASRMSLGPRPEDREAGSGRPDG
jgi:DNA polymerase-1